MQVNSFFDQQTSTWTYLVFDQSSKDAIVIDPVLDYNPIGSKISFESIDKLTDAIESQSLNLRNIIETHAHADHLSGAAQLHKKFPQAQVGIGENITIVQKTFSKIFNFNDFDCSGSQFHHLFKDGEVFEAGTIKVKVISTPGHTPACLSYLIEDMVFTGDVLFQPDIGVGRCDFPEGSATDLYHSVTKKLYSLPDNTRVFVGHDYPPAGRIEQAETTILESKEKNIALPASRSEEDFVKFREQKDAKLNESKLIYPSIQLNINGVRLPEKQANGLRYLNIPVFVEGE